MAEHFRRITHCTSEDSTILPVVEPGGRVEFNSRSLFLAKISDEGPRHLWNRPLTDITCLLTLYHIVAVRVQH